MTRLFSVATRSADPRIGRDLWPAGRLARAIAGILFLAASLATTATAIHHGRHPVALGVQTSLAFLAIAATYTLLVWAIGERLLARCDPWLAALVLIAPLALVSVLPGVPEYVLIGADFYLGISLLVQAAIGYGGCEIAGIPALVLRRRYSVYCALNGVDVAERRLLGRPRWQMRAIAALAFLGTMALFAGAFAVANGRWVWVAYGAFVLVGYLVSKSTSR